MIIVPLLHYFEAKNNYSGSEGAMRYRIMPSKRKVTAADGTETEENILTVDVWPDPWTIEFTDPALCSREVFPLSEAGRTAAAEYLAEVYAKEPGHWANRPSILDCEPWRPPQSDEGTEQ